MSTNKKTLIDGDFQVGSNHFVVDTENNYVGFNNVAPQNKIDVQIGARTGTHSTGKPLYVTGVTSTSGAEFVSDDGTAGIGIGSSNIFTTEANQNLTIAPDGTGAVGIKTATPNPSGETFDLWVQGDTKITGNVTADHIYGDGSGLFNVPGTQWVSSSEDIYFLNNTGSGEGRVSIGTSTPVSLLTLEGTSRGNPPITGTEGTSNAIVRIRDDNNVTLDIGTVGASPWTTWIQSSDATTMGTNYPISLNPNGGNVGVGTSSPGAPLEVSKSAGGEMLRLTNGTGTLYAGVDANPPWFGTSSDDHLRLMTNGTEKVRIESGGNVGIGTTNPDKRIHVRSLSNTILTGLDIETTSGSSGNDEYVGLGFGATSGSQSNRIFKGGIFFERKGGDTGRGDLLFCVENTQDNTTEVSPANAAMRINRFGLVSMTSGLNVFGNATFDTDTLFVDAVNNRVGIGKTDPGSALDVNGTVTATSFTGALSGNASTATSLETARTIGGVSFDGSANITPTTFGGATFSGDVAFDTNTLFVDVSANRVGIGTTSPSAPLHIYKREDTFGSLVELLRLERYTNDFDNRIDAAGGYIGFHANDGNAALGEVARISFRQKGESSTANAEDDGGMGFWTKLNDSLAQRMTIAPTGRVGIGTTAPASPLHVSASTTSTHTTRITHTDTNATSGTHALLIDANYSGADTYTGDKTNAGVYIDLDSSATGGDTSHEHRLYGVYSDVRHSGDSDICYSGYFYARSDHTSGQCSALRGVYAVAQDSANGTNSNNTGGEFKALKDTGSTNTTATMMGVRAEVEIDAGTVTNAYAVHGHIDRDGGTITNGFLFHGSYAGSDTGVKWGLHLTGDEKNHVDGSFGIGTDAPGAKLDVSGNVRVSTPSSYNPALQLGTQTSYSDDQLYSLRWGGDTLMGMGLHSSTRGLFGKQGLAIHIPNNEEFSVKTSGWTDIFAVDGATRKAHFSGYVGIGTSAPTSPLDVLTSSEGNYIARFFNASTGSDQDARIVIECSDSGGEVQILFITTNEASHSQWQIMAVSGDGKLEFQYQNMTSSINYNEGPTKAGFITRKLDNVSLNFTGQHRTFIKDTPFSEATPLEGLIVSADQNKYVKMSGGVEAGSNAITINESLPIVSLAKKANDKKCFGVISTSEDPETREESYGNFVSISQKEVGDTRIYINSVGEGSIWVTNINGPLESGDYITTSNVLGYGMRQDDDILHNYTVAKITMDCDFEPVTQSIQIIKKELTRKPIWFKLIHENVTEEEYKKLPVESRSTIIERTYTNEDGQISSEEYNNLDPIVKPTYTELSKVVYRKTTKERSLEEKRGWEVEYVDSLENVLDEHGEFQWEDSSETEKAYKIRYLDADGNITDEVNHVHKAAFVGCTYHCG